MKVKFINLVILCFSFFITNAQKDVKEAETMAKSAFKKMHKHEVDEIKMTEKQYVESKIAEYKNLQAFYSNISLKKSTANLCSNGDFENGQVLSTEWDAFWNGGTSSGNTLVTSGQFDIPSPHPAQIHHKVVPNGPDPKVNLLSTTDANTNKFSLRLGNAINGGGYESVSKKIIVNSSNSILRFSYATVLIDAQHTPAENPGFGVKIKEVVSGIDRSNLVNLGNGFNTISSDNPILLTHPNNSKIKYKKWSCASVDLSSLKDKEVIIEFFNRDCTQGGHWGYSYIDNICLECKIPDPEGTVKLNIGKTDICGPGKICINYTLPEAPNPSMIITLNLTQNGVIKKTLTSPNLTSGSETCFNITSAEIALMNSTPSGFEYHLIAKPKSGNFAFSDKRLGSLAEGIVNNKIDYNLSCPPPIPTYSPCCPPMLKSDIYPMFTPVFQGGASGPYTMKFTMPQNMKDRMQAYINLLKHTCKAKQLIINWQLCEVTAAGGCTNLETKAVIFTAGSTIPTMPTFFTTTLQQDKQYRITVIYKYDGEKCFDKTCDDPLVKPFEWDIDKKMGTIINKSN
jgi:hypothetical protein